MITGIRLTHRDRNRLVDELIRFPQWSDGDKVGEKSFLRAAGLPNDWIVDVPLTGMPRPDATNVISHLEELGHLNIRPTHLALGALVEHMLANCLHIEGRIFLAYVIHQYSLIDDSDSVTAVQDHLLLDIASPDQTHDLGWTLYRPDFILRDWDHTSSLEKVWDKHTPFLDATFLAAGAKAAMAVCLIEDSQNSTPLGTGFLIGTDLVITNHHVLPADEDARSARARFGYSMDLTGKIHTGKVFSISHVLRRSTEQELDFVVVQLQGGRGDLDRFGYLKPSAGNILKGQLVYIIQHPLGGPQKVVLQNNRVTYISGDYRRVQYLSNTLNGSSGSPVFNERWEVVALHHSSGPYPLKIQNYHRLFQGNEGIPISAILAEINDLLITNKGETNDG